MVYEVYGNSVEGMDRDADKLLGYLGNDFSGLTKRKAPLSLQRLGKATVKVEGSKQPAY